MRKRLVYIVTFTIISMLVLAPAAFADEGDSKNALGLFIGICIIAASGIVMRFTSRYFGRKRQANARKNRARAKSKRKR